MNKVVYLQYEKANHKPVPGFEGRYEISSIGRLKRLPYRKGRGFPNKERILEGLIDIFGYYRFALSDNGKIMTIKVHQLVGRAFIPNPNNYTTINHKDGNKANNSVDNLEWMSPAQNNKHAYKTGLKNATGEANGRAKLTETQVKEIYRSNLLQKDLAVKYGVAQTLISCIKTGRNWRHITQKLAS